MYSCLPFQLATLSESRSYPWCPHDVCPPIHRMSLQSFSQQHLILFATGWHDWKPRANQASHSKRWHGGDRARENAAASAPACKGAVHHSAKVTKDTRCHGSCLSHWELSTWLKPLQSKPPKQTPGRRAKVQRDREEQRVTRCLFSTARLPSHSPHCDMSASEHQGQGCNLFTQFHFLPITVSWQEVQGAESGILKQRHGSQSWLCTKAV